MSRIDLKALPTDISNHYQACGVLLHKALKQGASTIVVDTKDRDRDVWSKTGKVWLLAKHTPERNRRKVRTQ